MSNNIQELGFLLEKITFGLGVGFAFCFNTLELVFDFATIAFDFESGVDDLASADEDLATGDDDFSLEGFDFALVEEDLPNVDVDFAIEIDDFSTADVDLFFLEVLRILISKSLSGEGDDLVLMLGTSFFEVTSASLKPLLSLNRREERDLFQ